MRVNIYNRLRQIAWLRRMHIWWYENITSTLVWLWWALHNVPELRRRYVEQLRRVAHKYGREKIRVLFPISNLAKWKMQSLFDLLQASEDFDPIIVATIMDVECSLSREAKRERLAQIMEWATKRNMASVCAYDCENERFIPFSEFQPDIVWYQQPWIIDACQMPAAVSHYALTCYVPYFVQNYGGLSYDCKQEFHRQLWRHFTLSENWARTFMRVQFFARAGRTVGLGHPMLDQFYLRRSEPVEKKYVIYAPHFSCGVSERYSTFLQYGRKMLEFAQMHPEYEWVFKPHPSLRHVLIQVGAMTENVVEEYYGEWEKLGKVCYDADYVDLFRNSKVLITDCASFLVEYACTENPIIHLISHEALFRPHTISRRLFNTYYQVDSWEDFDRHFKRVVVEGDDCNRKARLREVARLNLLGTYAAKNIVAALGEAFNEG